MPPSAYASLHSFSGLVTRFTMSSDGAAAGGGGVVPPSVGDEPTATGDTAVEEDAPVAPIPPLAAVCHRHPPWRQEPYDLLKPMGEEVWLAERTCTSYGFARFREGRECVTSRPWGDGCGAAWCAEGAPHRPCSLASSFSVSLSGVRL